MKRKVLTLIGTRPELIRLSSLIPDLDEFFDHTLVHTGQNTQKELKDVFFEDLGIRPPDHSFEMDSSSIGSAIGSLFANLEGIISQVRPEAVLALGDTNSALGLLLAKRMGLLTYHFEAGNRSFDDRVPEEVNRRMIDHVADFNLCYTEHARSNLLREGLHPRFISVTGSPIPEVLERVRGQLNHSEVLRRHGLEPKKYLLASLHRQETVNFQVHLEEALDSLSYLSDVTRLPVIVSGHPRLLDRLGQSSKNLSSSLRVQPAFGFKEYLSLQLNASCVISDSGTVSEEASALGFPAVTIRSSMERPEAMEKGSVMLSGLGKHDLVNAVEEMMKTPATELELPDGYAERLFSKRSLRFVASTLVEGRSWKGLAPLPN